MTNRPTLVIDPNVYVSAVITPGGTCSRLVDAVDDDRVVALACAHLIEELRGALLRPKLRRYVTEDGARAYCETVRMRAESLDEPASGESFTADPDDDYLVALALEGNADAVVSGDPHLSQASPPVAVWTPREALDRLAAQADG